MIDGHIHYAKSIGSDRLQHVIQKYHFSAIALQCIPGGNGIAVEQDAFEFRKSCKIPVYIFGGLDRRIYSLHPDRMQEALLQEADRLMKIGCAGIKMLEGKPNVRKQYPIPDFESALWKDYWEYLEEKQVPVYMHVNDPEEFWNPLEVSEFAKKAGWFYDSTYINNEEQYRQILQVLENHPKLRILFPHFFFLSKQLDRLSEILDRYQNVYIDITPGIELYYNLSEQQERAKQFFDRYQERICFGTDIGARAVIKKEPTFLSIEECESRMHLITGFLETKGPYILKPDGYYVAGSEERQMCGLGLQGEILDKIYEKNFLRFAAK